MKAKGVFFDLCGTILTYGDMAKAWEDWQSSIYNSLVEYGLRCEEQTFNVHCTDFFAQPEPSTQNTKLTIFEKRIEVLGKKVGLLLTSSEIKNIASSAINSWGNYLTLDFDVIATLKKLKQDKCIGLITNFDHPPYVHSVLKEWGINELFDTIIISGEVGVKKPNPKIFSLALEQCKLEPHEIVYVGDTISDDIQGALGANIRPILIQRDKQDKVSLNGGGEAVLVVNKLSDLNNVLITK